MKILLPLDGSAVSLQAVRQVIHLMRQGLRAEVVLANVQEPAQLYELVMAADTALIARATEQAGAKALKAGEALLRHEGIPYATEIAVGDPAHTLIDIVERFGCDMVVMGARDKGSLRSALLGSVSHEVLHAAQVPVMLIKPSAVADPDVDVDADVQPAD